MSHTHRTIIPELKHQYSLKNIFHFSCACEMKNENSALQPPTVKQAKEGKKVFVMNDYWFFSSSFHFLLSGTTLLVDYHKFHSSKQYEISDAFLFLPFCSGRKNNNISQAHNKSIFYCTTLPGLERKPIIDGIINVINLHNQYLFAPRKTQDTCLPQPKLDLRMCDAVKDDFCLRTMLRFLSRSRSLDRSR